VPNLLQRGKASLKKADYTAAIEAFTKAIQLNGKCVEAYRGRGMALSLIGDAEKAKEDFAMAIRLTHRKRGSR
jgi:Flp pilus assembly protein TadD